MYIPLSYYSTPLHPPPAFSRVGGPGRVFLYYFSTIFGFAASLRLSGSPGRPQTPPAAPRRPQNGPKTPQDAHKTCRRRLLLRPGARKLYKTWTFSHFFAMRHNASKTHRRRFTTAPRRLPDASKKKVSRLGGVLGRPRVSWGVLEPSWGRFEVHFGPQN